MNFITKKIPTQYVGIIDIGSSKIRVGICSFENKELTLIGYGEKRQNIGDMTGTEVNNIKWVCDSVTSAIEKAEKNGGVKIENIIINIPFDELFVGFNKLEYIRQDNELEIDTSELQQIIDYVEYHSLKKQYDHIFSEYGYHSDDVRLILSSVQEIYLDDTKTKKILHKPWARIDVSLINICIPESKYELIHTIESATNKKILQIIPSEFALYKITNQQKSIVIIDIGSCSTSIIVKKKGQLIGIKKLSVGIGHLISRIQQTHPKTHTDIIRSLESDLYRNEKKESLSIFGDVIGISLFEILWSKKNCPSKFFITGWWANQFLTRFVQYMNLASYGIGQIGTTKIVSASQLREDGDIHDNSSKSNLGIYAMMMAAREFIKKQRDPVEDSLKKTVEKLK